MIELPKKKYLRPDEVADYFNVSRSVVYNWVEHGLLDGNKLTNGTLRISIESMKRFEENGLKRALNS